MSRSRTTPAEILELPRFGDGPGVERTRALVTPLSESGWWRRLDAIKVTGSNGKGSVARMTAAILAELGVSMGLYTSPHLRRFAERMVVDGEPIASDELRAGLAWLTERRAALPAEAGALGHFEATTALAAWYFARRAPATVVVEAGIGGRLDPTRLFPGTMTALTSVDLEHTALLGSTRVEIARDKAALASPGTTLVVGDVDAGVLEAVRADCARRDVEVVSMAEASRVENVAETGRGTVADVEVDGLALPGLEIAAAGAHQATNAALAIYLARSWLASSSAAKSPLGPPFFKGGREEGEERGGAFARAVRQALGRLRPAGCLELVRDAPPTWIDVAHTPAATRALAATVAARLGGRPLVLVAGVSADKDARALLAPLLPLAGVVVTTRARERGAPASAVAKVVAKERPELPVVIEDELASAFDRALALADASGGTVLVAGGLFLARETMALLEG